MLDQAIADMKKGQTEARDALIDAKTELRLSEKRRDKALAEASQLEARAMQALDASDEALARRFVEQKLAAEERAEADNSSVAEHHAQIKQLEVAERELERRLAQMPAKRAALMARQATASARGARTGATAKARDSVSQALDAFDRMEDKIIRAEVEAEVRTDGDPMMLDTSSLDSHKADLALAALKSKMAEQITAGDAKPDAAPAETATAGAVDDSLAELKARLGK